MHRHLCSILVVATLSVLVLPIANYIVKRSTAPIQIDISNVLFDTDLFKSFVSWPLYFVGVSIDPSQAVIGKQGWIFLGDAHALTLSEERSRTPESNAEFFRGLDETIKGLSDFFSKMGVSHTVLLIGPNKSSIYPENLPDWARLPKERYAPHNSYRQVVNPESLLIEAKKRFSTPLYFRTDTHWNANGAGIAFRALVERLKQLDPLLQLPDDSVFDEVSIAEIKGGDLSRFLRISDRVNDQFPFMKYLQQQPETIKVDFDTGHLIFDKAPPSFVKPLRVLSEGAFNQRRVLWLQDSFAAILAPLSAMMFSDVVHWSWVDALQDGARLSELVRAYKPEIVIFTVVERSLRNPACSRPSAKALRYCLHVPSDIKNMH